ncbi:MAG: type II secretion system protein GspE, partial [Candidatus Omnitrophica bacterium]|nr:type II secretion system protein GspE [Candidatus Omnitrophota bacterium]
MERKELGQLLLEKGLITTEQLEEVLELQKKTKKFIGELLIEKGYAKKEDILEILTEQQKADYVDLSKLKGINPEIVKIL